MTDMTTMTDAFHTAHAVVGLIPSTASVEMAHHQAIVGCLLGTALGDAWGLPFEGLSRRRAQRWMGGMAQDGGVLRHRLLPGGWGLCSDDTEHTCMLAQALLSSRAHTPARSSAATMLTVFRADLTRRLRWWLLGLPAGIGWATLRALLRHWVLYLWPKVEGVASAGNGPAMRCALLGVCLGHDLPALRAWVRASTRITHTDIRAEQGALAVALAAHLGAQALRQGTSLGSEAGTRLLAVFEQALALDDEWSRTLAAYPEVLRVLRLAQTSADRGDSTETFAAELGCGHGVSGFVMHTVPVALHAWMRDPHDWHRAIQSVLRCGGDTDTVAAITGAVVGAAVGEAGLPAEGLSKIGEWPRSVRWQRELAHCVAEAWPAPNSDAPPKRIRPLPLPLWGLMMRNGFFFWLVLAHGLRRLLPPY